MTSFDTTYANVPAEQRDALRRFRAEHPPKYADLGGAKWSYVLAGQGEQTVLLLVGGLRVADAAYRNIPMLTDQFLIVTPSYPPLPTMAALADGLAGVLDTAGVEKAHVLAGSFGGMLAQVFVRRHPNRVAKLILSTTAVLDSQAADRYRQILDSLRPLPPDVAAQLAEAQMFSTIAPPEAEGAFWRAYLHELYSERIDKAELISTYEALLDYAEHYHFTPADLDGWPGEMLILESDDDGTFDESARAAVRALYPRAQTHTFHGAGHSPGTTQRDLYFRVVKDFLRG